MSAPAYLNPIGSGLGPILNANNPGAPYPALVPGTPVGAAVGLPPSNRVVASSVVSEDTMIPGGALRINPALAGEFFCGKYTAIDVGPGDHEPQQVTNRVATQSLATANSPNAWKLREPAQMDPSVLFGGGPAQPALKYPWRKAFIPPLALFNDASQWVNRLFFNQPMPWYGVSGGVPYPLKAQYNFGPKPVNTSNLAAGELNMQLQLGTIKIQGAQLTADASNYFGG